jgi:SAM-dependent methyltransferase
MDVLYELFDPDLPRQGPGSDATTRRAWTLLGAVPPAPTILDIGCGSGMQTLELARLSAGRIIAIDTYQPYLDALQQRAAREHLSAHILPRNCSMEAMDFAPNTFDLIWSEAAIYILGFDQGLAACRPLLKPNGFLVFSELTWLIPDPAPDLIHFWSQEGADIRTIDHNLQRIHLAGYRCLHHFTLPNHAWWDDFYRPLEQKIPPLLHTYRHDPERLAIINNQQREIDLYRTYPDHYGYVFYLMQS